MGRAARNHGGTGGHGYFPLPGERPNYNNHIMQDMVLFNTVKNNVRKHGKSSKLNIVKPGSNEEILSTRQSAHFKKEKISLVQCSNQDNPRKMSVKSKESQVDQIMKNQKLQSSKKSKDGLPDSKEPQRAESMNDQKLPNSEKDTEESTKQNDCEGFLEQSVGLAVPQPKEVFQHLQVTTSSSEHKCALPDRGSVEHQVRRILMSSIDSRLSPEAPEFKSKEVHKVQPKEREAFLNQPLCLSLAHQEQVSVDHQHIRVCTNTTFSQQKPEISLVSSGLSFLQPSILNQMPIYNLSSDLQQSLPITQMQFHNPSTYMLINGASPGKLY